MSRWLFVDDQPDAAASFADALSTPATELEVRPIGPKDFREECLGGITVPDGVLMDVELSNEAGERGSGPGIAQDIRVKQRTGELAEFPVVRFARRAVIATNIGGDTSSSDLFDLKIQKEEVTPGNANAVVSQLLGALALYAAFKNVDAIASAELSTLVGLPDDLLRRWTPSTFLERLSAEREVAVHCAVLVYVRTFLNRPGLLIDEDLLSFRLGIDRRSGGWDSLKEEFAEESYKGVGHDHFNRWWARGLEDWWYARFGAANSLNSLTIQQRHAFLAAQFGDLSPLTMPDGSPGERPWRLCELSLERIPPEIVPVDPAEGARLVPRGDFPPWVDPAYASARRALASKDKRIAQKDMQRLAEKYLPK